MPGVVLRVDTISDELHGPSTGHRRAKSLHLALAPLSGGPPAGGSDILVSGFRTYAVLGNLLAMLTGARRTPAHFGIAVAVSCAALACAASVGRRASGSAPDVRNARFDALAAEGDPGRVTLHRLNRSEYNNTVRDLFRTTLRPADDFVADDHGYGFDNIADVLTLSPVLFEQYQHAAETLVAEAVSGDRGGLVARVKGEALRGSGGGVQDGMFVLWSNGEAGATVPIPSAGKYWVRARLWGSQAGPDGVKSKLMAGGVDLGDFEFRNTEDDPLTVDKEVELGSGAKEVRVSFLNDYYVPEKGLDRNLYVDYIEVAGPERADAKASAGVFSCDLARGGTQCAEQIVRRFATRAWRRPVTKGELGALMRLVSTAPLREGVELALQAILVSPKFVFRLELDPDPHSARVRPLTGYELASRLSYFLWSSMPDDRLTMLADKYDLQDEAVLRGEVHRMLRDPRAAALIDDFAGQWLFLRALDDHEPEAQLFPEYGPDLEKSMRQEARLFFRDFLTNGRPIEQLLSADYTFVDQRLAKFYGLPDVRAGSDFQRVELPNDAERGGLLRQAAVLTLTSMPNRTSPVKRGKWVLGQLLCAEPPPPPPGVPNIEATELAHATLRQRLEEHRKKPECATCHDQMDPIGLALENYDAIGRWRTLDNGQPVDATTTLPSGKRVNGAADLARTIAGDRRFPRCLAQQLFVYALGRGLVPSDERVLDGIVERLHGGGFSFEQLVSAIAESASFRLRRGEGASR